MNPSELLGKPESLKLEFKSAGALEHPERIAREAVAMLNAEGGRIWIGFDEEESHATRATGVTDAARQVDRLNDTFMNRIEPRTAPTDVVPQLTESEGLQFICVEVASSPSASGYCYLDKNRREFLIRIGSHIRVMSREEIIKALARDSKVPQELLGPRRATELIERGEPKWSLFFEVEPANKIDEAMIKTTFLDPAVTGVRSGGWIIPSPYSEIRQRIDHVEVEKAQWSTSIDTENGWIEFKTDLESLESREDAPRTVWPYALIEYTNSAIRVGAHLYQSSSSEVAHVTVTFVGLGNWHLRPYSPRAIGYTRWPKRTLQRSNGALVRTFAFDLDELRNNPDAATYRIAWWIYDSFGHDEEAIPFFASDLKHLQFE